MALSSEVSQWTGEEFLESAMQISTFVPRTFMQ
jgi:hypothetical protein